MKNLKRILICLMLLVIFGCNMLNVQALEVNVLEKIADNVSEFGYWMSDEFYVEGSFPNEYAIRNYVCWTFDIGWDGEYVVGYEYEEGDNKNGPMFKVPAEVFEKYLTDTFAVDSTFISTFRENFTEGYMINDADYVTEDGKSYYKYTLVTGWGIAIDFFAQLKGVKDLGNNTYQAYYYYLLNEDDLDSIEMEESLREELRIDEDSVLGRDYVIQDNYFGEETRYIVMQFYNCKIQYNNGVVKYLSHNAIEKGSVPSDSELALYFASEKEAEEKIEFLDGANQEFDINGDKLLTFRINAAVDLFNEVYIDGKLVDASNYTVKSGSTIITFNKNYINKLSSGKHSLDVSFKDGTVASTIFNLKISNPETFTNNYELVVLMSLFVVISFIISCKTKKHLQK